MKVILEKDRNGFTLSKEFNRLTKSAQDRLIELFKEDVLKNTNRNLAQTQKKMMKMLCIAMDRSGMTSEQCLLVLANMREVYRTNTKIETDAEQEKWLNGKMDEIFGEGGYPYEYIDKLEEM